MFPLGNDLKYVLFDKLSMQTSEKCRGEDESSPSTQTRLGRSSPASRTIAVVGAAKSSEKIATIWRPGL